MKKLFTVAAAMTCFWAASNKNAHSANDFMFQGPIIIGGIQANFLGTHNGSNISAICGVEETAGGKLVRRPEYNLDMVKMQDNYIFNGYVQSHPYKSGDGTAPPPFQSMFQRIGNDLLIFEFKDHRKRTVSKMINTSTMTSLSYEKRNGHWTPTQENIFKPQDVYNMYKYTTDMVCNAFVSNYTSGAQRIPGLFGESPNMPAGSKADFYNSSHLANLLQNGLKAP